MLCRDPASDRGRDLRLGSWRCDDVLLVGELPAGERERAVGLVRERRDPVVTDCEGDRLRRLVGARHGDPLGGEEDARGLPLRGERGPDRGDLGRLALNTGGVGLLGNEGHASSLFVFAATLRQPDYAPRHSVPGRHRAAIVQGERRRGRGRGRHLAWGAARDAGRRSGRNATGGWR